MNHSRTCIVVFLTLALAACATQHAVEESQVVAGHEKVESLLVVALVASTGQRAAMEDSFSTTMAQNGVPTQPTYPYLPTLDMLADDATIIAMYKDSGANMGLTIEWLQATSEKARKAEAVTFGVWLAGLVLDEPALRSAVAYSGLAAYGAAGEYKLRINLWDAADGELQWTMDTRSFTNQDIVKDAERLAEVVYDELKSKGLL